ncbi:hypothetical protein FB451DRAFT_1168739 [Mycena latifolia]|nr:hypothetical protein FB451DRAFT_1168739 [Mycena latifolia]
MEDDKIAGYFWLGIHHPKRDTSKAPAMEHVKAAAEEYFKRDQFPANLLDARDYGYYGLHEKDSENSDTSISSSESGSSSEDEDSDEENGRKWKRKLKKKLDRKKKHSKEKERRKGKSERRKADPEVTRDEDRTTKADKNTNEVEDIIERLNTMSIRDPHYGAVYYKALKMDPLVVQCIHREPLKIQEASFSSQRQSPPHLDNTARQNWKTENAGPATYPNNIPQGDRTFNPLSSHILANGTRTCQKTSGNW